MLLTGLLITVMIAGAFANGRMETGNQDSQATREEAKTAMLNKLKSLDTAAYTGEIYLTNRMQPEFRVGGEVYQLVVFPMHIPEDIEINDGDTITVTGAIVTEALLEEGIQFGPMGRGRRGYRFHNANPADQNLLLVTKWTVNGKTYDLAELIEEEECPLYERQGNFNNRGRGRGMGKGFSR